MALAYPLGGASCITKTVGFRTRAQVFATLADVLFWQKNERQGARLLDLLALAALYWDLLRPAGTAWDLMGLAGTRWGLLGLASKSFALAGSKQR